MLVEVKEIKKEELTVVTSLDVAETFEKEHRRVLQDIRELKCSEEFRLHNFVLISYKDSMNRKRPMYYITRDGFTLLVMGYTGEKAMKFKESYINQFNQMEKILKGKQFERAKRLAVRNALTDAIKESGENDRMHNHAYSTYTDLIYKAALGSNARTLREKYGISKNDSLRDFLTGEELEKVKSVEMTISGLVNCGWGYGEIKGFVENNSRKLLVVD